MSMVGLPGLISRNLERIIRARQTAQLNEIFDNRVLDGGLPD